jgi:hypothetical protein
MFFISISGKAAYSMDSMVRYNFPVFVMLVMIFMSSFSQEKIWEFSRSGWRRRFWILGYLLAAAVQVWMIRVFTKGGWVA